MKKQNTKVQKEDSRNLTFKPYVVEARNIPHDRHTLEKARLSERKEGFQRHDPSLNILHVPQYSAGYLSEKERFQKDVAGELKAEQEYFNNRKNRVYERIKREREQREQERWKRIDEQFLKEDAKLMVKRENKLKILSKYKAQGL